MTSVPAPGTLLYAKTSNKRWWLLVEHATHGRVVATVLRIRGWHPGLVNEGGGDASFDLSICQPLEDVL